jgi:hypothetical protein
MWKEELTILVLKKEIPMNCPHCNYPNGPANQFCQNCGLPLQIASPRKSLWVMTARLLITVFGLWIIRTVLVNLAFVQDLRIPDFPLATTTIINVFIYALIIYLLISFIRTVAGLWPLAFPRYREGVVVFQAIVYLIVLSQLYKVLQQVLPSFNLGSEGMLIIQLILVVLALTLVFRASVVVYHAIPSWVSAISDSLRPVPVSQLPVEPVFQNNQQA